MSRQPREAAVGLKAFHYFPRLPMELQFDILELAAQTSRIVRMDISGKYPDRDRGLTVIMDGKRREQVPPLLVTNHLTRHVALKIGIICVTIVDTLDPTRD